jgi:hypothetical protein
MGLFVKHAVQFNSGFMATSGSGILAGMVVSLGTNAVDGTPVLSRADRNLGISGASIAGLAGDDATNIGNTQILVDPVAQVVMSKPARRISDYLDETIERYTNWTDPGTAKRGVTVFSVGGEFATDQYVTASSASSTTADAGAAPGFAINDGWTWGSSATVATNIGKIVDMTASPSYGTVVVRLLGSVVDGLLPFRWVFAGA